MSETRFNVPARHAATLAGPALPGLHSPSLAVFSRALEADATALAELRQALRYGQGSAIPHNDHEVRDRLLERGLELLYQVECRLLEDLDFQLLYGPDLQKH